MRGGLKSYRVTNKIIANYNVLDATYKYSYNNKKNTQNDMSLQTVEHDYKCRSDNVNK